MKEWLIKESKYTLQEWLNPSDVQPQLPEPFSGNTTEHTLGGCFFSDDKFQIVPKGVLMAIANWCANCLEPIDGPDHFYNRRSMWKALNMIYLLLDELEQGPQTYRYSWGTEKGIISIPQIRDYAH